MTQTTKQEDTSDANQPSFHHAVYRRNLPGWNLINDLLGGTRKMREKAATYLPQAEKEPAGAYKVRVARTELFNGFLQTVEGLTGIMLRKPPQLGKDTDKVLLEDAEDIDLQGTHFEVFARQIGQDGLAKGYAGIFVDMADAPPVVSKKDEEVMGLRPYWVHVRAEDVINWRVERIGGRLEFTLLVIRDSVVKPAGEFGQQMVTRYRVYQLEVTKADDGRVESRRVTWSLWDKGEQDSVAVKVKTGVLLTANGAPIARIPFSPYYAALPVGPLTVPIPLEDLAHTTVAHYQVRADRRYSLHLSDVPILALIGGNLQEGEEFYVGPNATAKIPMGGDLKWVAPTAPLEQTRIELQDLIQEMASFGLAYLSRETRAAETAEAKRMDKEQSSSKLVVAGRGLQDALEGAWAFHAEYRGVDTEVEVQMDLDPERLSMDPATMTAYDAMVMGGRLSLRRFWQILQLNRMLPDDFDEEEELKAIAEETLILSGAAAEEDDTGEPGKAKDGKDGKPGQAGDGELEE